MARRRRRKGGQTREAEGLQVELLTEQEAGEEGHEAEEAVSTSQAGGGRPASEAEEAPSKPPPLAPPPLPGPLDRASEERADEAPTVTPDDGADELDGVELPVSPGRNFADRWARAVGRSAPARSAGTEPRREANGHEAHESARDHAAARGRPAGEPLARAKDLVQRGRVDEAIDLYLGILTVNPTNLKAHNNLGVLLDGLRQYERALEHFEAAERIAPENVELLTNYASTLTSVARYDEAEALLRRAQRLDAESLQVRLAVGILYFRRGLYGQAEAELRWVCARDRDSGQAFYYRGEALNRLGRFDEAGHAMERAKVLLPNDPRPFYTLGHLYDRKHQAEEAAEMYRHARRLQRR
jgi:tetratricopeptide (TPR) repeat protein